jgi:hypothetical protein
MLVHGRPGDGRGTPYVMASRNIVALVLALAVLAGLGSAGAPALVAFREGEPDRLAIVVLVLVVVVLGLLVSALVVFLARGRARPSGRGAPPFRGALARGLPAVAVAVSMTALFLISRTDFGHEREVEGRPERVAGASERRGLPLIIGSWWDSSVRAGDGPEDEPGRPPGPDPGGALLLIVALLAASALAGGAVWRWRTGGLASGDTEPGDDYWESDALRGAVAGTIDAMLADPDPGTAIRGAYARLLEGLDATGSGRRDHEGPMEHLERVLRTLEVRPRPLRLLIELFERARFSTLALTQAHRQAALAALRDVAADLAAGPTGRRAAPSGLLTGRP